MSLKTVQQILLKIKETKSTNAKIAILAEKLENDDLFCTVIELMYNESMHFKVNKLDPFLSQTGLYKNDSTTDELLLFLRKLSDQKGASNADKQELARLASIDQETYDVIKKVINKDAKSGFSGKSINKAWSFNNEEDLLFLMPYCRCSTAKKKMYLIDYENGAIGQEKADGMFANLIIGKQTEDSLIRSRNGNIVHQMDHLHAFFKYFPKKYRDTIYMGELLIMVDGKVLPRKTGNGYLNSCLQNAAPSDKAQHAIIKLWDAVPQKDYWAGKCDIPYSKRLARVSSLVKHMRLEQSFIQDSGVFLMDIIDTKMLYSEEEAQKFYKGLRENGKEGAIVKNKFALWKDHTSPNQVKMKNVSDAELRVVSWKYGKEDTKFSDVMGSVQLESDDGLIKVSVSGFTDAERLLDWDARIGKVGTLEYEGLTWDKSRPGEWSLYLPQNLEMRPERMYTDTYEDLKNR